MERYHLHNTQWHTKKTPNASKFLQSFLYYPPKSHHKYLWQNLHMREHMKAHEREGEDGNFGIIDLL